jgi:NTE family protein
VRRPKLFSRGIKAPRALARLRRRPRTVAVAFGGGGARGLAHIVVIEALDEMGVLPVAVAGTSIGAVIGACYAAGMTGKALRRLAIGLAHRRGETIAKLIAARAGSFAKIFSADFGNPMVADAEKICAAFLPPEVPEDFSALPVPLIVLASDLYARQPVVFRQGPLKPALAASMAVPGLLRPVVIDGRVLVDGGAVDPLPFEHLRGLADVIVAVDVGSATRDRRTEVPDPWECLFATLQIMGHRLVAEKLRHGPPDVLITPHVGIFRMLDFLQASAILRVADAVKAEVREKVGALIS